MRPIAAHHNEFSEVHNDAVKRRALIGILCDASQLWRTFHVTHAAGKVTTAGLLGTPSLGVTEVTVGVTRAVRGVTKTSGRVTSRPAA